MSQGRIRPLPPNPHHPQSPSVLDVDAHEPAGIKNRGAIRMRRIGRMLRIAPGADHSPCTGPKQLLLSRFDGSVHRNGSGPYTEHTENGRGAHGGLHGRSGWKCAAVVLRVLRGGSPCAPCKERLPLAATADSFSAQSGCSGSLCRQSFTTRGSKQLFLVARGGFNAAGPNPAPSVRSVSSVVSPWVLDASQARARAQKAKGAQDKKSRAP